MACGLARCGADLALLDLKSKAEMEDVVGEVIELTGEAVLAPQSSRAAAAHCIRQQPQGAACRLPEQPSCVGWEARTR